MDERVVWQLPSWLPVLPEHLGDEGSRLGLVLDLAQRNIEERPGGGPFAAAVVERDSGRLVSVGMNQVEASGCSSAHAEIFALTLAQSSLGSWDLGAGHLPEHQLVVSWRPCAMCLGAVVWSGVVSLLLAGDGPEIKDIAGFDEGPVASPWHEHLVRRGIDVRNDRSHDAAVGVLAAFARSGRAAYNPRRRAPS